MANAKIENQETRDAITQGYLQAQGAAIEAEAARGLDLEEVKSRIEKGEEYVIRFKSLGDFERKFKFI